MRSAVVLVTKAFTERLSPDANDVVLATAIRRCAETALAEHLRAKLLRGDPAVTADDALRVTRAADALTRRLDLDQRKPRSAVTFADLLQQPEPTP